MSNYILAGVGTIEAFTQSSTQPTRIFTSKTLQESGISISVTAEDIRGGLSNPLLGRYFHDSILEANITDALFNQQCQHYQMQLVYLVLLTCHFHQQRFQ